MLKLLLIFLNVFLLASSSGDAVYTYNDNQGSDWELGVCATNTNQQSPIDLTTMGSANRASSLQLLTGKVTVTGGNVLSTIANGGHTVKLSQADETVAFVKCELEDRYGNEKKYESVQFHFHSPSEHFVNGEQFDLEMHIVMANKSPVITNGRGYGVLGFLFKLDNSVGDIDFLESIIKEGKLDPATASRALAAELRAQETSSNEDRSMRNRLLSSGAAASADAFQFAFSTLFDLLPKNNMFWHYEGGLTTPTCDEAVNWYVNKNYIRVNEKQLKMFSALWKTSNTVSGKYQGNNRILQDLGARKIYGGKYTVEQETDNEDYGQELLVLVLIIMAIVSVFMVFVVIGYLIKEKGEHGRETQDSSSKPKQADKVEDVTVKEDTKQTVVVVEEQ